MDVNSERGQFLDRQFNEFIDKTKPILIELLEMKKRFRDQDLHNPPLSCEDIASLLAEIESKEREVLLAWASSTKDINPTMLDEVKSGSCKYNLSKQDYLVRVFGIPTI